MLCVEQIEQELKKLPNVLPSGELLLNLAKSHPLALAIHTIVGGEIDWKSTLLKRGSLIVDSDSLIPVTEALASGGYRYDVSGSQVVEMLMDAAITDSFQDTLPSVMYLQMVDRSELWICNKPLLSKVAWIPCGLHEFLSGETA